MKRILLLCLSFLVLATTPSFAATIDWTDWTQAGTGVVGDIGGNTVTYSGPYSFAQLGSGTNYWTEPSPGSEPYTGSSAIDNAPTPSEMIALNVGGTHSITFTEAVWNPVMAIVSMGQTSTPVTYDFTAEFDLLSNGIGYWSYTYGNLAGLADTSTSTVLIGTELHAAIQFNGWVDTISWDSSPNEYWHGITVGASAPVPEPATMMLFGIGLLGLAGVSRRKK